MERLINFQDDLYLRLSRSCINYKNTSKERLTKEYVEGRLEAVEQLWFDFSEGHKELIKNHSGVEFNDSSYVKNDTYERFDDLFWDCKIELKTKLSSFKVVRTSGDNAQRLSSANVKLPKVNIAPFSGKCYTEWTTFRELFMSLIHSNDELDDVQKFLYLKGYLTGEAKQLLNGILLTHNNYSRAWNLLDDRYNNRRYVSSQILEQLIGQKNATHESASSLKGFLDTTNNCLNALSNIGIETRHWDILIVHILVNKLDLESRRQWEFSVSESLDELPTYKQFQEFLTKRYRALEFLDSRSNMVHQNYKPVHHTKSMHMAIARCSYCSFEHKLSHCLAFKKISVNMRRDFVQLNKLCFCCLSSNHIAINCKENIKCCKCMGRHSVILHQESVEDYSTDTDKICKPSQVTNLTRNSCASSHSVVAKESPPESVELASVVSGFIHKRHPILLPTALVNTVSRRGQCYKMRSLLDQGSQSSLITETMVKKLGLRKSYSNVQITGAGGNNVIVSKAIVNVTISSRVNPLVAINVCAHVVKSITTQLPTNQIKVIEWDKMSEIMLADPKYYESNCIDILLGAKVYGQILQDGVIKGPCGSLIAQCTSLGWILSGALQ